VVNYVILSIVEKRVLDETGKIFIRGNPSVLPPI
jgi:hypothetical protein